MQAVALEVDISCEFDSPCKTFAIAYTRPVARESWWPSLECGMSHGDPSSATAHKSRRPLVVPGLGGRPAGHAGLLRRDPQSKLCAACLSLRRRYPDPCQTARPCLFHEF